MLSTLQKYLGSIKAILIVVCIFIFMIIFFWPQKVGDVRLFDGKATVYWRGPDLNEPGRWLTLDSFNDEVCDDCATLKAGDIFAHKVVIDCVPIGNNRCLVVFDDYTAVIIK